MSRVNLPFALRASIVVAILYAVALVTPSQTVNNDAPAVNSSAVQSAQDALPKTDERAEKVLQRAVEAAGGSTFLAVRAVVSRGFYTPYRDGVSGAPISFVDYVSFPDRNRTEFKGGGVRLVNTFAGETGWTFNADKKQIADATPEELKDFRLAVRTSLDNILRGWWRKEGARLSYAGRREAGLARRNEAVRVTYPDGFAVEFEFGAKDALAYKSFYKRQNKEGEEVEEEDRYARHVAIGGVTLPSVVDHFRAGAQTSRVSYETIQFDAAVPDSLFAKPSDIKALK